MCLCSRRLNHGLGLNTEQRCTLPCYKENPLTCQRVTVLTWLCLYTHSRTHTAHNGVHVFVPLTFSSCWAKMPPHLPHQRIICKLWSSIIGRGPLMCPWAFSTQTESHRRAHTDNRAACHGFWKVTLRIAFNIYIKKDLYPVESTCWNVHASKQTHAFINGHRRKPKHSGCCQTHNTYMYH